MNTETEVTALEHIVNRPGWFRFKGIMMLVLGSVLSLFSTVAPNMQMLGTSSSWLPVAAALIMLAGILRGVDAYTASSKPMLLVNVQGSMIDLVCGFIILTSVGETMLTFSLLVAAYLLIQGLFRIMVTFILEIPNAKSARIGGAVSVLMGLMAWMNWPFSDLWFLSFALSAEVAIRGWALMQYGNAVHKEIMMTK